MPLGRFGQNINVSTYHAEFCKTWMAGTSPAMTNLKGNDANTFAVPFGGKELTYAVVKAEPTGTIQTVPTVKL